MIITQKRNLDDLMENIKRYKSFFLVGCSECASLCGTGGTPELAAMKEKLEGDGKKVTGTFLAKTGCQVLGTKVELKPYKDALAETECILVMSCGAGTQTAVDLFKDKPVYATNDSLFLGNMTRMQIFDERCSLCGECILDKTGGVCPVTACPKGIMNGPCGGTNNGKCEVSSDIDCAWVKIYTRMKDTDQLEDMKKINKPKNWAAHKKPMTLNVREKKEEGTK
ncbi:MAG: methylenetetrahydrofolate reductase C-terminal domain-containing protein [Nitrospira sp.]|nr:methylenetetrahydrofolate reductase C-terminal domain-containing protein [bacterium]MBL7049634.1 methylenetetrahydrofolate reductase C-terminal domain-containing protein [Nitrospira sp.]